MTLAARYAVAVNGIVQGVGFRPFAYALAQRFGLAGAISNRGASVWIEVEGAQVNLDAFVTALQRESPPLAQITSLTQHVLAPLGDTAFHIADSAAGPCASLGIGPDSAVCDACLRDCTSQADRRSRYPFTNCTHCGPRLTIANALPYDRAQTSMRAFAMCDACRGEYEDPNNRRFHAQPIACPTCGPTLRLVHPGQPERHGWEALQHAAQALAKGAIVALKGLGGYQLACRADQEGIVQRLRARKVRPTKPFALMVENLTAARAIAEVSVGAEALLTSAAGPIVLLPRLAEAPIATSVAPHSHELGIMLPTTPLHVLLCNALSNIPLVMTSGNAAEEPLALSYDEARQTLQSVADHYLDHNRPITVRCDDSVVRAAPRQMVRRARGYAPAPLTLPVALRRPTLALGGHLKATFALGDGSQAIVSQHIGDLDNVSTHAMYTETLAHYERLHAMDVRHLVHDMHPDYATTRLAETRARDGACERLAVQHHHAHMASCMAENQLTGTTLGVVFDGAGYGLDGTLWGGEFFVGDYRSVQRVAHLRTVPLPGGSRAMREPWRMALAHAHHAGIPHIPFADDIPAWPTREAQRLQTLLCNNHPFTHTSSMGRLFDAVAALLGFCAPISFEAEAAQRLEWLALDAPDGSSYNFCLGENSSAWVLDPAPVIRAVCDDVRRGHPREVIARRFHHGVCNAVVQTCERVRAAWGVQQVVLTGGVFMNALLVDVLQTLLESAGFSVHTHRTVPSHDGGLSLGQLAVAAARGA